MTPTLAATLAAILFGAGYLTACAFWPFAACYGCRGDGKRRSPTGRSWRTCRRCKGSGTRLRVGRRLWNSWQGLKRDGTR